MDAQLPSLALLAYMIVVFGRFLLHPSGSRHAFRHDRPAEPADPAAFRGHTGWQVCWSCWASPGRRARPRTDGSRAALLTAGLVYSTL
ncbi:hypothetical protein OG689_27315 [Kitasatospora sp. NBC_00240]|uniref:hypothetical protein n=1 Tax=Kitasatospora sp. NBC_00240 TaxID=2903567 RepID=UPI00224D1A92|nr:hypothetical protein [Kitasatospora sp. NBC_00240]MCX5212937.1 hypothetical protein [Kitasatospora sp. NBC_00240]